MIDLGKYLRYKAPLLDEGKDKLKNKKAVVYLGFPKEGGEKVILKVVNKNSRVSFQELLNESQVMKSLNQNNILRLKDEFDCGDDFIIVTQRMNCDLFCLFFDQEYEDLSYNYSEDHISRSLYKVVEALDYMHQRGYIHRDIKLENIYIRGFNDLEDDLVVADFGFTKKISFDDGEVEPCTDYLGTIHYRAPEIIACNKKFNRDYRNASYSFPADVYAFGVMLYIILLKSYPINARTEEEYERITLNGDFSFGMDFYNISSDAQDLIERCLKQYPEDRITFQEMLDHPWFNPAKNEIKQEIKEALPELK